MNRSLFVLRAAVLTAAVMACAPLLAAPAQSGFPSTPPAPGPAPKLDVPTPSLQTLDNGLQVVSVRRATLPLVSAQLLVRSGSAMDPAKDPGLADLTAHLLTKGAAGLTAPQIAAAAEALGGSLNADAGWDSSSVGITVTTTKLPDALKLLADVVRKPAFDPAELKRAKTQAADDLRLALSRPTTLASIAASRSVFGSGAYGHSRTGTPKALARIKQADVQHLHAALYRPDNAVLILTGDITPAQALSMARSSFGGWKKPATPLAKAPPAHSNSTLPALLLIDQSGAGQAGVVAAHLAPARKDSDYAAGTVANAVLGGSYSARLNQEIRIKRGLSYGASSRLDNRRSDGLWLASAQTKNPSAPQVVDLLLGQFAELSKAAVPAEELAARKATLIGSYARSLETTAGLAEQVGELALYGINPDQITRYVDQVKAVTAAQVQAYGTAHLGDKSTRVVVVGDAKQFAAAIDKAHPQAKQLESASLDLDSPTLGMRSGTAKYTDGK